jgi:soluble lytic murein transglycosylase-like protein
LIRHPLLLLALTTLGACGTVYPYDPYEDGRPPREPRPSAPSRSADCATFMPLVDAVSSRYRLDPALVAGVVETESRWQPRATSRVGARGLMQIMPSTGRQLGCGDLYDPADNVECGARLLRRLLDRYDGAMDYALAAYAIGARDPDKAFARGEPAPRRSFIDAVLERAARYRRGGCG